MAISKKQPMRPAEVELVDQVKTLQSMEANRYEGIQVIPNNNTEIYIEFNKPKKVTPVVLITLLSMEDGTNKVNCYAALTNVSINGFHVRIYNLDETNNHTLTINWLAIGE